MLSAFENAALEINDFSGLYFKILRSVSGEASTSVVLWGGQVDTECVADLD